MSLGRLQNLTASASPRLAPRTGALVAACAALTFTLSATRDASAGGPVSPTGKGIVGGALLGGEVVVIPLGAAGVNRGWPYFVFGGLGMVGGGIGGYFVEKATKGTTGANGVTTGGTPEPALYMLAGGMALVIPALVVSLNATAYKPPESDRVEPARNEPAKDAPKAQPAPGAAPQSRAPVKYRFRGELASLPHVPVSLLDVYKGKVSLGVPAVDVRPLYTMSEMWRFGVNQGTEVRLPVFKAMF